MTREFIDFVTTHEHEDTARLLLGAARYPSVDMPAAVQQIEGRRTAREKWPLLLACDDFLYPPRLNREQASSEATARHKAAILAAGAPIQTVADLTGGMGVDALAFAAVAAEVHYAERNEQLCSLMEHNSKALGLENISVHRGDSLEWLASDGRHFDILFVDPARRAATGRKVAAFEDCEPDILQHLVLLRSRCRWLMVKASPMIDIDLACRQLGSVAAVHVVSVRGECKEVLFVCCGADAVAPPEPVIRCAALPAAAAAVPPFTRSEEAAAAPRYGDAVGSYLYEPDAALMKGGPFNLICQWMNLEKLAPNTHLYTADRLVDAFPGRTFRVLQEIKPSRKSVAEAIPGGKAHVVTRNYPVEAAALQRQLGLKEGGDLFVVAATVGTRPCAFLCRREG